MNDSQKEKLKREVNILKNLNHPNIVQLFEVFEDDKNIFLVMELCDGQELFEEICQKIDRRETYSEKDAAMIIKQVLSGIAYCHDKDVAHRDLKPENILISKSKQIKIIDFGLSTRFYTLDRMNLNIGTLAY